MWLISLFWQLITDPGRFTIDHWPSIIVVAFLISCIWLLPTYMMLLKSKTTWVLVGVFALVAGTWSVRGRWDDDQFEKERAGFRETIAQIEEAQQAAIIAAQDKVRDQEKVQRANVADALAIATKERDKEKSRSDRLQKLIGGMPDEHEIAVPKGCPAVKRGVDPVLKEILKRGS